VAGLVRRAVNWAFEDSLERAAPPA
jgi:hypothetical protein